ncbi:MAG: aspartate aminotransferase family protein [Candidatus Caldarchaeum sp.]|nr:aspartate aminotransferase family protein [Candidatus Caldarchaeum sp.]MDW8360128.1 aspartate aminotransferase family protein [Candidatus Caldarchaeum sp.]
MNYEFFEEAQKYLPGGVTYSVRSLDPFPVYIERSDRAYVWDVRGNRYIDFWMGHGALLMGHGYRPVIEAASEQIWTAAHLGYPNPWEVKWAKQVCSMVPSAQKVRPTNSGTEANMYAVRTARGFTGRKLVGKIEGGWHGGYDALQIGVTYPIDKPSTLGLPDETTVNTILLPFNDLDGVEKRIKNKQLAAIVVEPVLGAGGFIPAEPDYLKGLRELCDREGVVLIFDEVITGFRLSAGGAQKLYGVIPDMTVLGKCVGGGPFPSGAFCGRSEIMDVLDHLKRPKPYTRVFHGGTYSGNPLAMRAGYVLMKELEKGDVYPVLSSLGERARRSLEEALEKFEAHITGVGSLVCVHFTKEKPVDIHTANRTKDLKLTTEFSKHMLSEGILYIPPYNPHFFISAAHSVEDVDKLVEAAANFAKKHRS